MTYLPSKTEVSKRSITTSPSGLQQSHTQHTRGVAGLAGVHEAINGLEDDAVRTHLRMDRGHNEILGCESPHQTSHDWRSPWSREGSSRTRTCTWREDKRSQWTHSWRRIYGWSTDETSLESIHQWQWWRWYHESWNHRPEECSLPPTRPTGSGAEPAHTRMGLCLIFMASIRETWPGIRKVRAM